jgi:hypothetical protein
MKLYERSIQLLTMYDHTLLKLSNFLYKGYGQKYVSTPICNFFDQIWILLQLLCCNLKK